jgi:hypothetical protein
MGFRELFELAHGRSWTRAEEQQFSELNQEAKNACVKQLASRAAGVVTEDRIGTDGQVYTAFWRVSLNDRGCSM